MENKLEKTEDALENMLSEQSQALFKDIDTHITTIQDAKQDQKINHMMVAATQANVIRQLKKLLTDNIVKGIKENLENTALGFKTDKKDSGYPVPIIRNCLIQAALEGFFWHGNEFNIIAENCYYTKDGLRNKMRRDGHYTNLRMSFGIPDIDTKNLRATIVVIADFISNKQPQHIEEKFSVKISMKDGKLYTTDDSIIGKAERKMRKKIIEMVTGDTLKDGEADEYVGEVKAHTDEFNKAQDAAILEEIQTEANKTPIDITLTEPVKTTEPTNVEKPTDTEKTTEPDLFKNKPPF